ncbi:MAG: Ppx/GppA phosphatase family protein [Pseudobdellovibrionaceae bacterium]
MLNQISAIDIGSNAIRMMIAEISDTAPFVRINKKFRAPVRLGHDVFTSGIISHETIEIAKSAFLQFAEKNREFQVQRCKAVATSACREAKNRQEFIEEIRKASGIEIDIIDGTEEGRLIHLAVCKEVDLVNRKTMLIDIGGGSVEVTFSNGSQMTATKSFPMGTVRILENLAQRKMNESHLNIIMGEFLNELGQHIYSQCEHDPVDFAIGTGGNLECLGKLKVQILNRRPNSFVTLMELAEIINRLKDYSIRDRIEKLKLRPDRADVIVPAAMVVQTIMRQAETEKLVIPGVGLRDGIVWSMIS